MRARILVVIPFESTIGFAIGRYIPTFLAACELVTGSRDAVHFSFTKVDERGCLTLPTGFSSLLEFDPITPSDVSLARLSDYIARHEISLLFGMDIPVQAWYLRAARRAGVKTVVSYWGAPLSSINRGLILFLKRMEVHLRSCRPDLFVLESMAMQRTAVSGRGVPKRQTVVIPTGIDTNVFRLRHDCSTKVHDVFGINRDMQIVVYMGHLHERKGVHVLLSAATEMCRQDPNSNAHFLFLGNCPGEQDAFDGVYDKSLVGRYITFGGYRPDVPELLAGCRVGCVPSTGWDSFPLSALEMQACGLPVVVSDCQGVPETISNGETGMVTQAGNVNSLISGLQTILSDELLRLAMSRAARIRIENHFTRERQIEQLAGAISLLL